MVHENTHPLKIIRVLARIIIWIWMIMARRWMIIHYKEIIAQRKGSLYNLVSESSWRSFSYFKVIR